MEPISFIKKSRLKMVKIEREIEKRGKKIKPKLGTLGTLGTD